MSSIWTTKPWWCQPWSSLLPLRWLNALVTAAVMLWWLLFLVLVPSAYAKEMSTTGERGDNSEQAL